MSQIVFLTLYLGLVSGRQPVELRVDSGIALMRLSLDGKPVATLTSPPWRATVDFGRGLAPQQLIAIGFDKAGHEVTRATQAINVPRPIAEADVAVKDKTVELGWRHRMNEKPTHASLRLDDKALPLRDYHAALPAMDMSRPHVLEARLTFPNGDARIERVVGGTLPDVTGTELTPAAVHQTGVVPASLEGCFTSGGETLGARPVEKPDALVVLVRNPNPRASLIALGQDPGLRSAMVNRSSQTFASLDAGSRIRILWPVAENYAGTDLPTSQLFSYSGDFGPPSGGMLSHLVLERGWRGRSGTIRLADAVAVAGVQAADGGRRRAVVVALDGIADTSRFRPSTVRRYLASIGVPLFVWSVLGPQPDLEAEWGPITDVSNPEKLRKATDVLRLELESQRIVWLDADPIRALRASLKPSCGLTMLSRP